MKSLNKVMLIGNLGKDPELRYTSSGTAVANFSMATSSSYKDQDGNIQERTEWHNIVAWKKLAEITGEYLHKGAKVYVEGQLQTRSYDDKNGVKRYTTEVKIDNLIFLDSRNSDKTQAESPRGQANSTPAAQKDDDLPF
jgi:single-strand DNA-binding protein